MTLLVKGYDKEGLTRPIRFVAGFFAMNSARVPFGIHSETICKGFVVTPMKGTMFGCRNLFQMIASLKNDYEAHTLLSGGGRYLPHRLRTLLMAWKLPVETLKDLIETFSPR